MWCKIVRSVECHWWILFVFLFLPQKTIVLQNEAEILFTKLYNMAMQSISVTKSE